MRFLVLLCLVLSPLFLIGCQSEEQKPAPTQKTAAPATSDQAQQTGVNIQQDAEKQVEAMKEDATKQVAVVKEQAEEKVAEVQKEATEASNKAQESMQKMASDSQPKMPAVAAPVTVPVTASPSATPPGMVTYDASQGTVSFDHGAHMTRAECSACHPTTPPEKIAVDKAWAHSTCKGCHKKGGAGPTSCKDCHKK